SPETLAGVEPSALRETLMQRLAAERDERERARGLSRLGVIADDTSRKVAQFYEASPYPRWSSMVVQRNYQATLAHFLGRDATTFMAQPFEVLIAGCGTGLQAIQSAINYGPNARMLAIDLSAASLGYAARMAEAFGVGNIAFAQGDLQQAETFGPQFAGRFQLIEAVGVLHHMADPFAGWRELLKCLAPGGLMRVGLYSATARRSLAALRGEAGFPGPGCGEEALRAYRRTLLDREDPVARDARKFVDFWDAKSFRDLLLHVTEHTLDLAQIAAFLAAERLQFRGFQLPKAAQAAFFQHHPRETWPGLLETWAKFEAQAPSLFENMYLFWCERPHDTPAPA
ncbi:MAG TPA: class I SAM-dependent methyltransferase, partial [Hyphomicrobiaceae bacterium]|nr:class I SAM-dependent methyltransferase [Hyphomicrobiaceae bacterium]